MICIYLFFENKFLKDKAEFLGERVNYWFQIANQMAFEKDEEDDEDPADSWKRGHE